VLSFFETIGFGYTVLATLVFTVQVIYCAAKGFGVLRHFVERGRGGPERRVSANMPVETNKRSVIKISS
jgi:hypothetical protein